MENKTMFIKLTKEQAEVTIEALTALFKEYMADKENWQANWNRLEAIRDAWQIVRDATN